MGDNGLRSLESSRQQRAGLTHEGRAEPDGFCAIETVTDTA